MRKIFYFSIYVLVLLILFSSFVSFIFPVLLMNNRCTSLYMLKVYTMKVQFIHIRKWLPQQVPLTTVFSYSYNKKKERKKKWKKEKKNPCDKNSYDLLYWQLFCILYSSVSCSDHIVHWSFINFACTCFVYIFYFIILIQGILISFLVYYMYFLTEDSFSSIWCIIKPMIIYFPKIQLQFSQVPAKNKQKKIAKRKLIII